ncbi:hypothetical protein HD553DRAFT_326595 [Filobasidium floriforme]|uniref:uncharacterized protein n=1 Tax=Filobasidium floriforme TaxID=5210 RepID=UPI001E8EBFFF|nr:uncharacterized protein HD553DRAFT_326595 [Filobasidium floriforme]KAH8079368.1 hypothetical protein HD553DRAFT_326595 [Filobasidium floriforme]
MDLFPHSQTLASAYESASLVDNHIDPFAIPNNGHVDPFAIPNNGHIDPFAIPNNEHVDLVTTGNQFQDDLDLGEELDLVPFPFAPPSRFPLHRAETGCRLSELSATSGNSTPTTNAPSTSAVGVQEQFATLQAEAKKRKAASHWSPDVIERTVQELERKRAEDKRQSKATLPKMKDTRRLQAYRGNAVMQDVSLQLSRLHENYQIAGFLLLMPLDADHPFMPQAVVKSPYLEAVLQKRWGIGGNDSGQSQAVLLSIQAAIHELRARRQDAYTAAVTGTGSTASLAVQHSRLSLQAQRSRLTEEINNVMSAGLSKKMTTVPWTGMNVVCLERDVWWECVKVDFDWGLLLYLGEIYVKGQLVLKSINDYDAGYATAIRTALKQMALKNDNKAAIKRFFGKSNVHGWRRESILSASNDWVDAKPYSEGRGHVPGLTRDRAYGDVYVAMDSVQRRSGNMTSTRARVICSGKNHKESSMRDIWPFPRSPVSDSCSRKNLARSRTQKVHSRRQLEPRTTSSQQKGRM